MNERRLNYILFTITVIALVSTFGIYAFFYKTTALLIRGNVEKSLLWSKLIDAHVRLQPLTTNH